MSKYFVVSDVHSFYREMISALTEAGFDREDPEHIFVSLGDLMDRGPSPLECLEFLNAIPLERKVLIRGNHEDLLMDCLARECALEHDIHNGTSDTVWRLAGETADVLYRRNPRLLFAAVREQATLREYVFSLVDYAEIGDYVFVHGWIPPRKGAPERDWRRGNWREARWFNGMGKWKCGALVPNKTVVCGHWHVSWGHSVLEKKGTEFGEKADFSPFIAPGIIAIDACTAYSHRVNCIVLDI